MSNKYSPDKYRLIFAIVMDNNFMTRIIPKHFLKITKCRQAVCFNEISIMNRYQRINKILRIGDTQPFFGNPISCRVK